MANVLDKDYLKNGEGELKLKNASPDTYHYLTIDDAFQLIAASAAGVATAGKSEDDPKETNDKDIMNIVENLDNYADYFGYCEALKTKYKDNIDLNDEQYKDIKPAFFDEKKNKQRVIIDISVLKNNKELKSIADKKSKEFKKNLDKTSKTVFGGLEKGDTSWLEKITPEFIKRWGKNLNIFGYNIDFKKLGNDIAGLAKKGVQKLENMEWNILTTGPKLFIMLCKGVAWGKSLLKKANGFKKDAAKLKKKTVEKEIEETIKDIEQAKKNDKIPE